MSSTPPPPLPPPALSITTTSMPRVIQGQSYSFTFQATGGTGSFTWTSVDPLPAGLMLSAAGVLSGTPTQSGSYFFGVQVQDSGAPVQRVVASETLYVIGALSLTNITFPIANRNIAYQFNFGPTGGTGPFTYSVTAGNIPPGMNLSNNQFTGAQMNGTPTQAGTFTFTLQATDSGEGTLQQTASAQLTMLVKSLLQITTINIASGVQNRPYNGTLAAVNGTLPLHWSVPFVPQGLTFDAIAGTFAGTPTEAVASSFAISVTDSSSPPQSNTASVDWFIYGVLNFYQTDLGSVGVGYTGGLFPISFTGGQPPVTSSLISGTLPPGMELNGPANLLDGAATQPGHYSIGVQLTDSASPPQTAQATLTFTITPGSPVLSNSVLPGGIVGVPYEWGVAATGGQLPYSWSIHQGSLPPGLVLDSLGLIHGTPTAAGKYNDLYLQVSDSFSPPDTTWTNVEIDIHAAALGRNDSIATATPLTNGSYSASISPYSDPSTSTADGDYYKLTGSPGNIVAVAILAQRLNPSSMLDPVLEIVDGSGTRYATCNDPASPYLGPPLTPDPHPNSFQDSCINDDDPSTQTVDSDLTFKVPGTAGGAAVTFYLHVLDWRGDARPDFNYLIQISGAN